MELEYIVKEYEKFILPFSHLIMESVHPRHGKKFTMIDHWQKHCLSMESRQGYTEIGNLKMTLHHLSKDDVVVDVGAAIGENVIHWSDHCKEIWAFDPMNTHFYLLLKNIQDNNIQNCIPLNYGLGKEEGTFNMVYKPETAIGASLYFDKRRTTPGVVEQECQVRTLDSFNIPVNYLKIDIEGGEHNCILGGRDTILTHKPILQVEMKEFIQKKSGFSCDMLTTLIETLGYSANNAYDNRGRKVDPRDHSTRKADVWFFP